MASVTPLPPVKFHVIAERDVFQVNRNSPAWISRIAWNIFSVVVFPVGLGRLALGAVKAVALSMVLPAAQMYNYQQKWTQYQQTPTPNLKKELDELVALDTARQAFLNNPANFAEQITVRTADGVLLDGLAMHHVRQRNLLPHQQKWIVYFTGNASCYERVLDDLKLLGDRIGANTLTANFRSVFRSQGSINSTLDLVIDAEAIVQYLLSKGVLSNNILVHGWSLGGAVATEVVPHHQEEGREMHLVSERSFASIQDFVKGNPPNIVGEIFAYLATLADCKFDGVTAYMKIKGYKFTIHTREDGVIGYHVSLYKKVKEANMSPAEKAARELRKKAKAEHRNDEAPLVTNYKPQKALKFTVSLPPNQKQLSRSEMIRDYGDYAHCVSLTKLGVVTELYIAQVKEALRILD